MKKIIIVLLSLLMILQTKAEEDIKPILDEKIESFCFSNKLANDYQF
jgi:hypothetical protein